MRQLKISLTDDLFRQLAMVSTAAGHSLASEIRRRLERTFAQEVSDPRTDELLNASKKNGFFLPPPLPAFSVSNACLNF